MCQLNVNMLTELVGIINKMFLLPYQGRYLSLYCNKSKTNFMQKELAFLITFYLIKSGSGKGYAIRLVQGAGKWQLYLYINHSLTFMAVRHIFGAIIPLIFTLLSSVYILPVHGRVSLMLDSDKKFKKAAIFGEGKIF